MSYLCDHCHYSECPGEPCSDFTPESGAGADVGRCSICGHGECCHEPKECTGDAAGARSAAATRDSARCEATQFIEEIAQPCPGHDSDGIPHVEHCATCPGGEPGVDCDHVDAPTVCAYCHASREVEPHLEYWYQGGEVRSFRLTDPMPNEAACLEALGTGRGIVVLRDGRTWRLEQDESWTAIDPPRHNPANAVGPTDSPLHHIWYTPHYDLPSWGVRLRALNSAPHGLHHAASIEWPAFRSAREARFEHQPRSATLRVRHPLPVGSVVTSFGGESDGNGSCAPGARGMVVSYLGDLKRRQGHAYQVEFPLQTRAETPDDPEAIVVSVVIDQGDDLDDPSCYQVEPSTAPEVPPLPADRLGVMLAMADLAYSEHMDEGLPDPETARKHSWGDLLADFITTEIREVSEGSGEPLHEAITAMDRAARSLSDVHKALLRLADLHPHAGGAEEVAA